MTDKQPTPIKRYDIYNDGIGGEDVEPRHDGDWVRYADLGPLLASHAAMLVALSNCHLELKLVHEQLARARTVLPECQIEEEA